MCIRTAHNQHTDFLIEGVNCMVPFTRDIRRPPRTHLVHDNEDSYTATTANSI